MKDKYYMISFSGGKDSTALVLKWIKYYNEDPKGFPLNEVIYCDVGMEFPAMVKHIDKIEAFVKINGIKFTRLKSDKTFEFLMFDHEVTRRNPELNSYKGYSWPDSLSRWCTKALKIQVIDRYVKSLKDKYDVVMMTGLAYDEIERAVRECNANDMHPLIDWKMTEKDCLDYCYAEGYDFGGLYRIFNRVSCWCCPLKSISELRNLRKYFPDLWNKLMVMDENTWRNFRSDYSVKELDVRFKFEDERISKGLSISNKEFYLELKKLLRKEEKTNDKGKKAVCFKSFIGKIFRCRE